MPPPLSAGFHFLMKEKTYESLPAGIRKAIDTISGDRLVGKFGDWWNKWELAGKTDAIRRGDTMIVIDEKTRDKWQKAVQPMITRTLARLKASGVRDPRGALPPALAHWSRTMTRSTMPVVDDSSC